jgi:hypothetical protein
VNCTANATAGGPYIVTATTSGATTSASFSLTNTAAATATLVFSASGTELINGGPNYYAVAGAFNIDQSTNPQSVTGGELDYSNGFGVTLAAVPITGGTANISNSTGTGTLTLVTASSNPIGIGGTITLSVAFGNPSHAVINQFDTSATSSGSMDLQTATNAGGMGYAFTLSGIDYRYIAIAYGGVFSLASGTQTGVVDINNGDTGVVTVGSALSGTSTAPDSFGRGTASFVAGTTTLSLAYYVVGPEVFRLIDVDVNTGASATATVGNAMLGSAYGQGNSTTFNNASLANSVFGVVNNLWANNFYAATGMIVPNSGAGTFTAVADDDPGLANDTASVLGGTYSISNTVGGTTYNGYGALAITSGTFYSANYGIYMTDPTINLVDPSRSTETGGALLLNLDSASWVGTAGVLVPQTDTTNAFSGVYAFGAQDIFYSSGTETDHLGQATIASQTLTGTGFLSDPFGVVSGSASDYNGVTYSGLLTPDLSNAGRYTMTPFVFTPSNGINGNFTYAFYQADGNLLFSIDEDIAAGGALALGTFEAQTGTKSMLMKGKPVAKAAPKPAAKASVGWNR